MSQYVLYYQPAPTAPASDLQRIRRDPHAKIVAAERDMVLLEADKGAIDRFLAERPGWMVSSGSATTFPVETAWTRASRNH